MPNRVKISLSPAYSIYTMPSPHIIPSTPGRAFTVAVCSIGILAIGLAITGGLALIHHPDRPLRLISPDQGKTKHSSWTQHNPATAEKIPLTIQPAVNTTTIPENISSAIPLTPGNLRQTITNPEVLELIEVATALRKDGDTAGALKKLREADSYLPSHPRILWELIVTYKSMTLEEKARGKLSQLVELGPVAGGEYYQIAKLSHDAKSSNPALQQPAYFSYGKVLTITKPDEGDGERVLVKMAIHSRLEHAVSPEDIGILIEFYDLVDGTKVEKTRSNTPTSHWPTSPVNWAEPATEIVEWQYHMPVLTPREIADFGERQYYGFIARLYHKNTLQDIYAEPRTLLAQPPQEARPLLDSSLFPGSN